MIKRNESKRAIFTLTSFYAAILPFVNVLYGLFLISSEKNIFSPFFLKLKVMECCRVLISTFFKWQRKWKLFLYWSWQEHGNSKRSLPYPSCLQLWFLKFSVYKYNQGSLLKCKDSHSENSHSVHMNETCLSPGVRIFNKLLSWLFFRWSLDSTLRNTQHNVKYLYINL